MYQNHDGLTTHLFYNIQHKIMLISKWTKPHQNIITLQNNQSFKPLIQLWLVIKCINTVSAFGAEKYVVFVAAEIQCIHSYGHCKTAVPF